VFGTKFFGANDAAPAPQTGPATDTPGVVRRRQALLDYTDISNKVGVEIGPYDRPIVTKDLADIRYADLRTTEQLKTAAKNGKNQRDPSNIVDIDFVLSKDGIDFPIKFDFIVASHVLEHVPDPVGWLNQLSNFLNPGGFVFLAVPDKQFIFDHLRPSTSLGVLLEKSRLAPKIPSPAEVFDAFNFHLSSIKPLKYTHGTDKALKMREKAIAGEFVGCHCNVFTSEEFQRDFSTLTEMGVLQPKLSMFQAAHRPFNDFLCAFSV
jgi:SAM-dependent methyltransferase